MNIKDFGNLLATVCENTSHFKSKGERLPRIVYAETGKKYDHYDNNPESGPYLVDVHFYTQTEFDPIIEKLEKLFAENNIPFTLPCIDFSDDEKGRKEVMYYLIKCEV